MFCVPPRNSAFARKIIVFPREPLQKSSNLCKKFVFPRENLSPFAKVCILQRNYIPYTKVLLGNAKVWRAKVNFIGGNAKVLASNHKVSWGNTKVLLGNAKFLGEMQKFLKIADPDKISTFFTISVLIM